MSTAEIQPTDRESIRSATTSVGPTHNISSEPNVHSGGLQFGQENTIGEESLPLPNPPLRQSPSMQGSKEATRLSLEPGNGWNQQVADGQNQPSHIANPGQFLDNTPLRLQALGSSPEDFFTVDLFPYIDSEFPQSQVDLAFSSNLDLSSGQPWLDDWWESRFVPMEGLPS